MPSKPISTFCRIRPVLNRPLQYELEQDSIPQVIEIKRFGRKIDSSVVNADRFGFNEIFDDKTSQEEVFEKVGRPVMQDVLTGYNGTIFAYGQTATGKTYSVLGEDLYDGNSDRRGLIPRSMEYVFEHFRETDQFPEIRIAFLEIYNERGYDLLSGERKYVKNKLISNLTEVECRIDSERVKLQNLTWHTVTTIEEAVGKFLEGSENRALADTYANELSSRSHCIFTIELKMEEEQGVTRAKVNFVDLAGSERLSKDHFDRKELIEESKNINKSLLFLHKVIEEIGKGSGGYVNYRNTMITRILRDSLIGNCITSLIATISVDDYNRDETISTCLFAKSVSKIETKPKVNKTEDLNIVIARLRREISLLHDALNMRASSAEEDLTEEEKENLRKIVLEYYKDDDPETTLDVDGTSARVQFCFEELKKLGKRESEKPEEETTKKGLTEEEMAELDRRINSYVSNNDPNATLEISRDENAMQYCYFRLKTLVREFNDTKMKKRKGGCCG